MEVVDRTVCDESGGGGPVEPSTGRVFPEHKGTTFVAALVVFALIGERVLKHGTLARRARSDAWFIFVQRVAVVVSYSLNHGLGLFNDFCHVGFHGGIAALYGEQRSLHVAGEFWRRYPFNGDSA